MIAAALLGHVRREGLSALPIGEGAGSLLERVRFLYGQDPTWPNLSEGALIASLDDWLAPILEGRRTLASLTDKDLENALRSLIPWDVQKRLDAAAPARWTAPTGSRLAIDYAAEAGPTISVRVQELYGVEVHPGVGGVPLVLALLSPAHRPIQVTRDLPAFWRGSWKDVRTDMKGRYPRHVWPEEPWKAAATTRAKPRGT
jgi:ATP-dependent helicase HrpB